MSRLGKSKSAGGSEGESEDPPEVEEPPQARPGLDSTDIFKWINVFVVHFVAKHVLEKRSTKLPKQDVHFPVIAVDRSVCRKAPSWSAMETIIQDTMRSELASDDDVASQVKSISDMLKRKISLRQESGDEYGRMIGTFQKIIDPKATDPIRIPAGLHCEVVLATFAKFYAKILLDMGKPEDDLLRLCKDLEALGPGIISVSKLCCPVCWELLAFLRRSETPHDRFLVSGCHSTLYPVELPDWLPANVVEAMMTQFQDHLRRELKVMLNPKSKSTTGPIHRTTESESGLSVSSSNTGDEQGSRFKAYEKAIKALRSFQF